MPLKTIYDQPKQYDYYSEQVDRSDLSDLLPLHHGNVSHQHTV